MIAYTPPPMEKFFGTTHGRSGLGGHINNAVNEPNTKKVLVWDKSKKELTENTSAAKLSVNDEACTAKNQTTFSTSLYRADAEQAKKKAPVDAAPCFQAGALPIVIQNTSLWQSNGCMEGFYCRSPDRHGRE